MYQSANAFVRPSALVQLVQSRSNLVFIFHIRFEKHDLARQFLLQFQSRLLIEIEREYECAKLNQVSSRRQSQTRPSAGHDVNDIFNLQASKTKIEASGL